jgi:hypothetical protein
MKISELPYAEKTKALQHQKRAVGWDKETDNLKRAFGWHGSLEGFDYWQKLDDETSVIFKIVLQGKKDNRIATIVIVLIVILSIVGYLKFMV